MTNGGIKTLALAGALVMATAGAAAAQTDREEQLKKHAEVIAGYGSVVVVAAEDGISRGTGGGDPARCNEAIAAAEKLGATNDDRMYAFGWSDRFKTYRVDNRGRSSIAFSEARTICATYAKLHPAIKAYAELDQHAQILSVREYTRPDQVNDGFASATIKKGKECVATMEKLIAGGLPATTVFDLGGKKLKADEVKAQICQALIDWGNEIGPAAAKASQGKRDEIAKKYAAAGIKGKRLELFIDYDDVYWRGKNCQIVDDVKALAKAKKLHHWLENADGSHTIRTYTFKGDNYTVKDKTYKREKDAWKGCK